MTDKTPSWVQGFAVALALLGAGLVGLWSTELPYYAFSPGPVGDALGAVIVDESVETFESGDAFFLLTVSAQEINLYELLVAAVDPTIDVVLRERVRPAGLNDQQFRERGLSQMDLAKEAAISVALNRIDERFGVVSLGIEVVDLLRDDGLFEVGDMVESVAGEAVAKADEIRQHLESLKPGDTVKVGVRRAGTAIVLDVDLIESADVPGRVLLGIVAQTRFPIDIASENIGGPSAGMMYTLAIIDRLTPGDLGRGHVIAGTGTIALDGTVGPIGGVRQKVVAAEAAGAEIMLVPEANYEEALTAPRHSLELISVASIDQALQALGALPEL